MTEARETTALEMPDHENTFVVKSDLYQTEFVLEAKTQEDMKMWINILQGLMKSNADLENGKRSVSRVFRFERLYGLSL